MADQREKDWKEYEKFIAEIFREIDPSLEVKFDDLIQGRQIDVSLTKVVAGVSILIIIQAKLYKKSVPINDLDAFESVIRQLRASKGILISNKGFTKGAKEKAKASKIDLCSVYDSSKPNFKHPKLLIPIIKTNINIKLSIIHEFTVAEAKENVHLEVKAFNGMAGEFAQKWIENKISKEDGHHKVMVDGPGMELGNVLAETQTTFFKYEVSRKHYFKKMSPEEYKGVENYITQNFTPSFIKFENMNPFITDSSWQFVRNLEDIPITVSHVNAEIVQADAFNLKIIHYDWKPL